MAFKYRTLCSGSSGNASVLWTAKTAILIDFGILTQYRGREALAAVKEMAGRRAAAVFVTHAHSDHINKNSLKILAEAGIKVHCHPEVRQQIVERCGVRHQEIILTFTGQAAVGDLLVSHIPVDHSPRAATFAFAVTTRRRGRSYKASFFTDLSKFTDQHVAFAQDSDLILLEASYDLDLYRSSDNNYGCEYHLPNHKAAKFLHLVCEKSARKPKAVVLAHLSERCNQRHLPAEAVAVYFKERGRKPGFDLHVAGKREPGAVLAI
ncbi:MAG TPA: hypothetical protein DCZ92_09700 [Elusimicrobia bacterium]|nr:MAG: hypothetical protein A2016_10760 [Elusimicrobia bacterium GWF2_62_30]HBA61074.1 hypothetical protein [Elusimicrobiota bacterium]